MIWNWKNLRRNIIWNKGVRMSEKQFKLSSETVLQYQIMNNDTDLNESEVVDLLNKLYEENRVLRQTTKTQQIRIYCQDKEIQKLNEQLNKIPNTIKEVWIE